MVDSFMLYANVLAERVISTMNFDLMCGKPIRIMWSQRDPAPRRNATGNIFIKNLDKVVEESGVFFFSGH